MVFNFSDFRLEVGFRTRPQKDTSNTVGLLATFNFGFKAGTLFVILSERRVHLVHEAGADGTGAFSWSSPPLDLQGNAWHRLELIPAGIQSRGGSIKADKMRFILDYHEILIDKQITWGVPVSAFIGGYTGPHSVAIGSKKVRVSTEN